MKSKKKGKPLKQRTKNRFAQILFSVTGTVLAAGVYTVAAQFINAHLF